MSRGVYIYKYICILVINPSTAIYWPTQKFFQFCDYLVYNLSNNFNILHIVCIYVLLGSVHWLCVPRLLKTLLLAACIYTEDLILFNQLSCLSQFGRLKKSLFYYCQYATTVSRAAPSTFSLNPQLSFLQRGLCAHD